MSAPIQEAVRKFERKQYVFAGLGLVLLLFVSIILNTLHMNSVAEQSTRFISRMIQQGEFREVGLALEDAKLNNFKEIHYISKHPDRSFSLPASRELNPKPSIVEELTTERLAVSTLNSLNTDDTDTILFVYGRFQFIPHAFGIWLLLVLVSIPQTKLMKRRVVEQYEKELALQRDRAQVQVAKEIRHNLRSPLAALMRIPSRLPDTIKQDRDLLNSTINQIKALIARLGRQEGVELASESSNQIYDSLQQSVQEIAAAIPKEIQFAFEIEDGIVSAHVPHLPHELRAVLGNVVANAVDAIAGIGTISLKARDLATDVEIEVQDSGHGIPGEIMSRIFDEGFSHGKAKGTGTGLNHAQKWIEAWGGTIKARSEAGGPTRIVIQLPIEDRAKWYVPRIRLGKDQPVFIVEDQVASRDLWRMRMEEAGISNAQYLDSPASLRAALRSLAPGGPRPVLLFDYDLEGQVTGLNLFDEAPADSDRYLVTGHFDDSRIRGFCEAKQVGLLLKSQMTEVPLVVF